MESLGASLADVERSEADERAGIIRSAVTGKPRQIVVFYGRNVLPSAGYPLVTVTHDIQDGDVDPRQSPLQNLLAFDFRASEVIGVRPNGMLVYALFDAAGNLQDSVPDNIAHDHTIPAPYTARLEPAISCIRCHGPHEGFQPFVNDVQTLLRGTLAVVDDLTALDQGVPEIVDRVQRLYGGDLSEPLRLVRNSHENAAMRACGLGVREASAAVSAAFGEYRYALVTARTVCRDLGYEVGDDGATDLLARLAPPRPADPLTDLSLEHATIAQLQAGLGCGRAEYEPVYPDFATRALESVSAEDRP